VALSEVYAGTAEPDYALGRITCIAHHWTQRDGQVTDLVWHVRYEDEYTRTPLGWQRPCYLMNEGYAKTYRELMDETEWERYGYGRDARCTNCMMHCGYEASSVEATITNPIQGIRAGLATMGGRKH
jgi:hypothetical protein